MSLVVSEFTSGVASKPIEKLILNEEEVMREKIKEAVLRLKVGKSAECYNIPIELIKTNFDIILEVLYLLLNKKLIEETIQNDWLAGVIIKIRKKRRLMKMNNASMYC